MAKPRLVLLDAVAIIEAHLVGAWPAILAAYDLVVPETVHDEAQFADHPDGRREYEPEQAPVNPLQDELAVDQRVEVGKRFGVGSRTGHGVLSNQLSAAPVPASNCGWTSRCSRPCKTPPARMNACFQV